ncbi:MAG: DNA primase [Akkermansiaceae bacterium]|nr:DNA primase [Akkermansiaceae bacterium]MDP4645977.1 DNA primase [Akkermansiaceae bacterium]MDP4721845.1 DNA primase [Akkermansiaceae bacterium]MDP4781187.1 DNA primase [Akkermansiaceae bacterium]MDP4848553.1 DNA primase [Akkermansiaceae bacterium]
MGLIPKETIEQVLASTDIVDLIGSYIPLKRAGTGYKANCPFHHEKTPSFNVSPHKQFYHCFGCGKSGNAIGFVMDHEGLLFMDALKKLASKAGVHLEEEPDDPKARAARKSRGRLLDLHREASAFFHEHLKTDPDCQHARDYLKGRGFGREMAEKWEIGWMPENPKVFLDWARAKKYTGKELVDCGFAGLKDDSRPAAGIYVRFRDRLMFPIHNEVGDVIAFSGRQLRDDPKTGKYINSPETDIFKKSNVLFALDKAKKGILKEQAVILCEGQIDAIACHEGGVENAIAPLGTAFTAQHARILKRYAKTAVLCFDADNAGMKASERAFRELAPEGLSVKVVQLPAGDDPDTYLKAHGVEGFRKKVEEARDFFDFKIETARAKGLLDTAEDRAQLARECTELLSTMDDHAARDQQINVVSTMLGLTSSTLREGIGKSIKRAAAQASRPSYRRDDEEEPVPEIRDYPLDRTVGYLCQLALSSAPAQHFLSEQFESIHEAKQWVEGVPLLEKILAASPDPSSNAAVNAFVSGLRPGEQKSLNAMMGANDNIIADGLQSAEQALGMLSSVVLQKRDAAVKSALKQPGITPERMKELLEEAKEIAGLLRWTGRSQYDDELPQETIKAEKKPWEKKWKK